jgi:predicted nucleic acid-binding protein
MDAMRWGALDPADCAIAVAAANSKANVLLSYDEHFANAKQHVGDRLAIEVIND